MRQIASCAVIVLSLLVGGCGGSGQKAATTSSFPPGQATAAAPSDISASAASAAPGASSSVGTATPQPTPTPDTNLLDLQNGTIVRTYTAGVTRSPNDFAYDGADLPSGATGPVAIVYELAAPAAFSSFSAVLPTATASAPPSTLDIAVGANGPNGSFVDIGRLTGDAQSAPKTLSTTATGRWVRITATGATFSNLIANGALAALPSGVSPSGIYVEASDISDAYKDGVFLGRTTESDPWYRKMTMLGTSMSGARCFNGRLGPGYPGSLSGRVWSFVDNATPLQAVVNDDASLIVGGGGSDGPPLLLMRVSTKPKYCVPVSSGSGPHHVTVLDGGASANLWPVGGTDLSGYSYTRMHGSMLDQRALDESQIVIFNAMCNAGSYLSQGQTDALLKWVSVGHKLLIADADSCSSSKYEFLPYQFETSNPGAHGASGNNLSIVENDALGASDKNDAHFFDPQKFINGGQNQLGDANVVATKDTHWCGHLFGTNAKNDNGFMQMYAPYGQGVIIYDGFDADDGDSKNPGYERVRTLEFQLPVPSGMPCLQSVAAAFLIQPSAEATFAAGSARTLSFPMQTLATLGWSGHVTVAATGDFRASVTPAAFDIAGKTQAMNVSVNVPASAKAGVYTVTVNGDDGQGQAAHATITLTATAPLVKKIAKHQRIRIYGIHFDVDSAHIQPQSERVVKEIADLMKSNPIVRFQVEGDTDSDGGAAYNLALSQRRAQAVVDDLIARYGIARGRLIPKGLGLTQPVKPNTTEANKALNRRVELLAL